MIVVACLEAVALIAVVWMLLHTHAAEQKAWTVERRELLERIQRPEHIPLHLPEAFAFPEQESDEFDKVGSIHFDPEAV